MVLVAIKELSVYGSPYNERSREPIGRAVASVPCSFFDIGRHALPVLCTAVPRKLEGFCGIQKFQLCSLNVS